MITRIISAIVNAVFWTCVSGAILFGGFVAFSVVINAVLWAQLFAAAGFALLVYIAYKERDDDGSNEK